MSLQDLRRRLYIKAKTATTWRLWGLYVHVCKLATLREAYRLSKANDGAPGGDGVTFEAIETAGVEAFLVQLQEELVQQTSCPLELRKVRIPKAGGTRQLAIPAIRDRVVQGALTRILEPIFEADFQPGSYGYRPKRSAHEAIQRVSTAILAGKTYVIDLDLRSYVDTVRHHLVLEQVATRVSDAEVLHLLKRLVKASGKQGAPQGGSLSPLLSNLSLTAVDRCVSA
jgi:RNA-directed DNA polymerase